MDWLNLPISIEHFNKLPKQMQDYEAKIHHLAEKLRFVYQNEQLGFGVAVSCLTIPKTSIGFVTKKAVVTLEFSSLHNSTIAFVADI